MSFLAPWALLMAAAAAVPLLLHLLRRRTGTRVEFPAVRYLLRAEKEHAREVRLRNFLLMMLRVAIVLAVAMAMARPIGVFPGVGHPPTAVALVVDNSLSSAAAGADGPALTRLIDAARAVLASAGSADAVTLVTADGEASTGAPEELQRMLDALRPLDGAGDVAAALDRARTVLAASEQPERRLVLLTDAQASQWRDIPLGDATVFALPASTTTNRAIARVEVEPPFWNPRGTVRATLRGDSASWRLVLDGRSMARGTASPAAPIVARVQPGGRGWMAGAIELEPDELRLDDVRHFAVHVGEPPALTVDGASGAFVRGAMDALVDAGRARRGSGIFVGSAERAQRPGLLFAPSDPLRVADANRALERAGIPWRFGARQQGSAPLRGAGVDGASARTWYALQLATGAAAAERADTLARTSGAAWAVAGNGYVLIASPADDAATDLPVRAAFVPWLDALIAERLSSAAGIVTEVVPGQRVTVPSGVDALEAPDGTTRVLRAGASIRAPWAAGVHFWRRGEQRAGALVVNPDAAESDLATLTPDSLAASTGAARIVELPERLAQETFSAGGRRALATPLLLLALGLLVAESWIARRARTSSATA
ncbi:MAG: BatA domain-containing protein [Gemmatimonadaceae bacterium]|nr:BatA domain-containing protein [Gemmatimonadaceae bacterium]